MNSLYPSLLGATGVMLLGWRSQGRGSSTILEGTNWIAFAYSTLLLIHLLFVGNHLFWNLIQVWSLWVTCRIFMDGHIRLWPSLVGALVISVVQIQILTRYPFGFWGGLPVAFVIGLLWFLFVLSTGAAPEQQVLTLSMAFLLSLRWGSSYGSASSLLEMAQTADPMLCNSYWIGGVLLSALTWIRPFLTRVHHYFHIRL